MTQRQITKSVRKWAEGLGLKCAITCTFEDLSAKGVHAEINYEALRTGVNLSFCTNPRDGIRTWSEEFSDEVILHELLHAVFLPYTRIAENMHGHSEETAAVYRKMLVMHEEHVVDNLAKALLQ